MKQLNKEQHDAIVDFIKKALHTEGFSTKSWVSAGVVAAFKIQFPAACCDECAEGHVCVTEKDVLGQETWPEFPGDKPSHIS